MKQMKKLAVIVLIVLSGQACGQQALGEVLGEVVEFGTSIGAYNAKVWIDDNGTKYQARADMDGRFRISAVPAGEYFLNVLHNEDTLENIYVNVPMDGFHNTGILEIGSTVQILPGANVRANDPNEVKLIDGNLPVATLTQKEIDKSPAKFDVKGLITSMSSDVRQTADGELVFRGARKGDMIYLIDGVKTRDVGNVPGASIGRMMIYTGGLPAKYGDTLGGVVVMESRGYFDLYRAWEADQIRKGLR